MSDWYSKQLAADLAEIKAERTEIVGRLVSKGFTEKAANKIASQEINKKHFNLGPPNSWGNY